MAPSQRDQDLQDALLVAGVVYLIALVVGAVYYMGVMFKVFAP